MKLQIVKWPLLVLSIYFFPACDSGPRVVESQTNAISANTKPFESAVPALIESANNDQHKVVVEEVLNTEKYSYLYVSENEDKFWIAVTKRPVNVGESYVYKGGLLKKDFFSREFNRVFETIYLVSNIRPVNGGSALEEATVSINGGESLPDLKVEQKIEPIEGAISLSDLFKNKDQYHQQTVKITGKCVKVNPMIMNRNWVHIQDGSEEGLDLTVTTAESIPLGAIVSLEGTIAIDKDFGAGYRYDIIMEGAVLR
jgi:hypothetical protein